MNSSSPLNRATGASERPRFDSEFTQLPGTSVGTAMRAALRQALPPGTAPPRYIDAGTLADVGKLPAAPGLYLIAFRDGAEHKAYSGKAKDLRQRLLQHRHSAAVFALPLARYRIFVAPVANAQTLRDTEKRINRFVRRTHASVFTNQRSEIEEAAFHGL